MFKDLPILYESYFTPKNEKPAVTFFTFERILSYKTLFFNVPSFAEICYLQIYVLCGISHESRYHAHVRVPVNG